MIGKILVLGIYFWHYLLVKILSQSLGQPFACRFQPSCALYAVGAIEKFGVLKGTKLAAARILKCSPFGKFGIDELE